MVPRYVAAASDLEGEDDIVLAALDQAPEPGIGKPRAGIRRDRADHLAIAARDEHIGHILMQGPALGDGQQMRLAFRSRVLRELTRAELLGLTQDRSRDLDRVVESKLANDIARDVWQRRKALRKPRARARFDLGGKQSDDLTEDPSLIVTVTACDQQVGRIGQRGKPGPRRALRYGALQFLEQATCFRHAAHASAAARSFYRGG